MRYHQLRLARLALAGLSGMVMLSACGGSDVQPLEPVRSGSLTNESLKGDVGILGSVSGLGSIVVNGVSIALEHAVVQSTKATIGQDIPLTVGSTVLVEAAPSQDGFQARRIQLFIPLVGQVDDIRHRGTGFSVLGTEVHADGRIDVFDRRSGRPLRPLSTLDIAKGQRVAVSGLWRGDRVEASRIDILERAGPAAISGVLTPDGDGITIGGTLLDDKCCRHFAEPIFSRAQGRYQNGRLVVTSLRTGRRLLFSDRMDRLIADAFLEEEATGNGPKLSGFGISVNPSALHNLRPGNRSLLIGRFGGAFSVRHAYPLPDEEPARTKRLSVIAGDGFTALIAR